jgi:TatA/E family protein of Tat protein translocase
MYYAFILESIGTSELILIGLVALIVFGPRKLPEFARTLGKMMNEFRRSTDDFKENRSSTQTCRSKYERQT